jgi:hypothetical protein
MLSQQRKVIILFKEFLTSALFGLGWGSVIYPWLVEGLSLKQKILFTSIGILTMILVHFVRKWLFANDER